MFLHGKFYTFTWSFLRSFVKLSHYFVSVKGWVSRNYITVERFYVIIFTFLQNNFHLVTWSYHIMLWQWKAQYLENVWRVSDLYQVTHSCQIIFTFSQDNFSLIQENDSLQVNQWPGYYYDQADYSKCSTFPFFFVFPKSFSMAAIRLRTIQQFNNN